MRGTILRDTHLGDGVVVAGGTQYRFDLQAHWRGERAPRVDQVVNLAFSPAGLLLSVEPVDAGTLTSEHSRKVLAQGKTAIEMARTQGGHAARKAVTKIGIPDLTGVVVLLLGTTVFTALSMRVVGTRVSDLNIYSMLGLISGSNSLPGTMLGLGGASSRGAGVFAVLWLAAILGPLIPSLSQHRLAALGYFVPLVLLIAVATGAWLTVQRLGEAVGQMQGYFGGARNAGRMSTHLIEGLWQGVSVGTGAYLTFGVTLFFIYRGWRALRNRQSAHS